MKIPQPTLSEMHSKQPSNKLGKLRGLPHYKQLNFGGGSDWLGATTVAQMGIIQTGDKNNVALKSQVLPHDELTLVFPWKFVW